MITRRQLLASATLAAYPFSSMAMRDSHVRIGLTPVILDDRLAFLRKWDAWLSSRLERPVQFVQRGKYREIMDLLLNRQLDAAWICGYPYVRHRDELQLLAVPVYGDGPWYQSYLIVNENDPTSTSIQDLANKVFAFSDPDSNSGYLYPVFQLQNLSPNYSNPANQFFKRTFFTWGHRHVIEAVASGLAHGGAVDGYVWEQMAELHPKLVNRTRIIDKSPKFAFPPLVTRRGLEPELHQRLGEILIAMNQDMVGSSLLGDLGLNGFSQQEPSIYAPIENMAIAVAPDMRSRTSI